MQTLNADVRRILVIDDNDAIHGDFRKTLAWSDAPSKLAGAKAALFGEGAASPKQKMHFELDCALQGEEGLKKLSAAVAAGKPFCLAFVDMRMPPGWDGVQTIQKLWEVDSDLQVVICTAYSDYSWEEISEKLGLNDRLLILKKPFDPVEVTQMATALSEKWSLRRAAKLRTDELEAMVEQRTRELSAMALHDKLTGLPNRTMLNERLASAVEQSLGDPAFKYALLFLDFDRFKMVNDSYGHEVGDRLLQEIAGRLTASVDLLANSKRVSQILATRLGGDEFVILIEGTCEPDVVAGFADGLLRVLGSPYSLDGRELRSTASIGITTSDMGYAQANEVLRDADTAMYHAKATGKARYVIFDRHMHQEVKERLETESDLCTALERGQMVLHYQPIISLATGKLDSFEALVRWNHPRRGLVPPSQFIPCCEEIGLIIKVGKWILNEACRQLSQWNRSHPQMRELSISVNLSANQLSCPNLVRDIQQALNDHGVSPESLSLEITESVMIRDPEAAISVLNSIRALGVRLYMDDFGTGYSSLSCLHRFPLSGLKIDRSFMQSVSERRDYAAVVHAIVDLARNLGMKLIAEGIETFDQVVILQALDCAMAQGFYFSKPLDPARAEEFIQKSLSGVVKAA